MKTGCIYLMRCTVTNKVYIGQTRRSVYHRWQEHEYDAVIRGSVNHLANAIRKYGVDKWLSGIIIDNVPVELLNYYEKLFIATYNSVINGYNSTYGGEQFEVSEKTRLKLSESHKGERHVNWGRQLSESTRKKISESNKGKIISDYQKRRLSETHKGKTMSEESRRKISETLKAIGHTAGTSNKSFKPWWYEKDGVRTEVYDMTVSKYEEIHGISKGTLLIRFNKKHKGKLIRSGQFKGMRFGHVGVDV